MKAWFHQAWRAATGRRLTALPDSVGPSAFLTALLLFNLMVVINQRVSVAGAADFSPYGWIYGWVSWPPVLLLVWLGLNRPPDAARHASPTAAWVLLFLLASLPMSLVGLIWNGLQAHGRLPGPLATANASWSVFVVFLGWIGLVVWRISQRLQANRQVVALLLVLVVAWQGFASVMLRSSAWEPVHTAEAAAPSLSLSQEVFEAQEALFTQTLNKVEGNSSAPIQVYGLVYAPYAQDVFLRESAMVNEVMSQRLGASGRVVTLLNHATATQTTAWATPRNLQRAIQAIAKTMRRDQDVLMIYLTSHGGADHRLASSHWPLEVDDLSATEVRRWLDEAGIRYRTIAVSACYSGGWVPPLSDDNTLIMTAADPEHTSYGCGNRSELTFFGRAVFHEALRQTLSLEEAFAKAVPLIRQREIEAGKDDGFSNPQIRVGAGFRQHWSRWTSSRSAIGPAQPVDRVKEPERKPLSASKLPA